MPEVAPVGVDSVPGFRVRRYENTVHFLFLDSAPSGTPLSCPAIFHACYTPLNAYAVGHTAITGFDVLRLDWPCLNDHGPQRWIDPRIPGGEPPRLARHAAKGEQSVTTNSQHALRAKP